MKYVLQNHHYDCGVACVCSILKYFHITYDSLLVNDLSKCSKEGVSGLGIKKALEAYLVETVGYQVNDISEITSFPGIALIKSDIGDHYVMMLSIKKDKVTFHDPLIGIKKISYSEFCTLFLGVYFTCKPTFKVTQSKSKPTLNIKLHKTPLLVILFLGFCVFMYSLLSNAQLKSIFDSDQVNSLTVLLFILIFEMLKTISVYSKNVFNAKYIYKYKNKISDYFIKLVLSLNYSYITRRSESDLNLMYDDAQNVSSLLEVISDTVFYIIMQLLFMIFIGVYSQSLFVMQLLFVALIMVLMYNISTFIRKINSIIFQANFELKNYFFSLIKGFQVIRSNNIVPKAKRQFNQLVEEVNTLEEKSMKRLYLLAFTLDVALLINYLFVLYYLFDLKGSKQITSGSFVIILTMFISFNQTFKVYPVNVAKIRNLSLSRARMNNLAHYANYHELSLENNILTIELRNVSFSYDYSKPLIQKFDLNLEVGCLYFITGRNGVGKSTLVKLIMGFLTPDEGEILYNDNAILQKITLINNESILFNLSIKDNITLDVVNDKQLKLVMQKLDINDDFLDIKVTNYGSNLSSGQKQLVLLARALYFDDNCIIFDEPFIYLASELKRKLSTIIRELSSSKLVIVVSHDRSMIKTTDKIINFKENSYERINF